MFGTNCSFLIFFLNPDGETDTAIKKSYSERSDYTEKKQLYIVIISTCHLEQEKQRSFIHQLLQHSEGPGSVPADAMLLIPEDI